MLFGQSNRGTTASPPKGSFQAPKTRRRSRINSSARHPALGFRGNYSAPQSHFFAHFKWRLRPRLGYLETIWATLILERLFCTLHHRTRIQSVSAIPIRPVSRTAETSRSFKVGLGQLFEEIETAFGDLTDEEKRSLKGLASAIEYHASKLKS